MEPLFEGFISWIEEGVVQEAWFGEGRKAFTAGASLDFEYLEEDGGWRMMIFIRSKKELELRELFVVQSHPFQKQDKLFLNGYQSWTESREYGINESIPRLSGPVKKLINTSGDYTFYNNPGKQGRLHSWSFATLRRNEKFATLWRDALPETGYTIFEFQVDQGHIQIRKDVGGMRIKGEMQILEVHIRAFEGTELSAREFQGVAARPVKQPATGWTSWYHYYTDITEQIIMDNLRAFGHREIPIDIFQIDDGWQPAIGDWMEANKKFPEGMKMIADQAHRYGMKAGLWLAPLIVEQKSSIFEQHQEWLLTHDGEHLVEAGFNPGWGGLLHGKYYTLNLDLPEVRTHLRKVFHVILDDWGYDLVKLDFLFAAAIIPANGKSRGQRMQEAFDFLRECCGDKLILACGVPLAASWGKADYCRIGPDVGLDWDMKSAKMIHLRERISTRNAIGNTIARRHFSGRYFANDPDVFILRKKKNSLSPHQKHTLYTINHIFGDLLFTSDNIGSYDAKTMRQYQSSFPALPKDIEKVEHEGEVYHIWFRIDGRKYFAAANLSRTDQKIALPAPTMYRHGEGFVEHPQAVYFKPFETRIYLEFPKGDLGIAGSDLHLFPGCEVQSLTTSADGIAVEMHPECKLSGTLVLKVRPNGAQIMVNGKSHPVVKKLDDALVILDVAEGKLS